MKLHHLGRTAVIVAVLILAAAVAPAQEQAEGHPDQIATVLKEFTVALATNPSTGFGWKVAAYDRNYLQLKSRKYRRPEPPRPGAAGAELFEFLPLKTGATTIVFEYKRPWENQAAKSQSVRVLIK